MTTQIKRLIEQGLNLIDMDMQASAEFTYRLIMSEVARASLSQPATDSICISALKLQDKDGQIAYQATHPHQLPLREGDRIEYPEASTFYTVIDVKWNVVKAADGELHLHQYVTAQGG